MKRISFGRSLLFCFRIAVPLLGMAVSAFAQAPDLLDSEGHIPTDILNPPQIERKLEQKIEKQIAVKKEAPSPFTPKASLAAPRKVTLPPTIVTYKPSRIVPSIQTSKTSYQGFTSVDQKPAFDLPITYNNKVKFWVAYFQGPGQKDFRRYLERANRYLPKITSVLDEKGLPRDLAYVAMIESGFSSRAVSTASAVGYWQFIAATANRYGLKTNWWLDERRDITKSTVAAAQYLNDLYRMFNSWYLAAAAYNMGEGKVKKLVAKYQTRNYWILSQKPDFPHETVNYIPKLMAALLIAKAPAMYGFSNLNLQAPHEYEVFDVPGGTDLDNLAYYMGIDVEEMRQLNPELVKGFVPQFVSTHRIRVPKGRLAKATEFIRASL